MDDAGRLYRAAEDAADDLRRGIDELLGVIDERDETIEALLNTIEELKGELAKEREPGEGTG